jgi:PAS domain S-box-containing protein
MLLKSWMIGFRNYFIRPRRLAVLAACITLLVGFFIWYIAQYLYAEKLMTEQRRIMQADISISAEVFKTEFNRRLNLAETIITFTNAELENTSQLDPLYLQTVLQGLYSSTNGIEFISLEMPDNVLYLFPDNPKSRQSHFELKEKIGATLEKTPQPELMLFQKFFPISTGQRLLVDRGIILNNGTEWGITLVAFDLDQIITDAGLPNMPRGWSLLSEDGTLLAGDRLDPALNPVRQAIPFSGETWEIQAAPPGGWKKSINFPLQLARWSGLLILVLLAALASSLTNRRERLRKSVDEQTQMLAKQLAERQIMTETLRHSEEQSRLIVESALDAIFIEDKEGKVLDCNEFACKMYGYSRSEMLELTVLDLVPPDIGTNLPRLISLDVMNGLEFSQAFGIRKDGEIFPTEVNIRLVDFGGQPRVIAYVRDLTERRQEQRLLAESELRYRSLMEILPEGILLTDLNGVIFFCNQHAAELHEFSTPDELIGCTIFDLIIESDRPRASDHLDQIRNQGAIFGLQFRLPRRDGGIIWVEASASLVPGLGDEPAFILGVERDITARQQADADQRLQTTALEAAANGIVITDLEGVIRWVNPAFSLLTGYSSMEAMGQHTRILNSGMHPKEFYAEMWNEIMAGRVWSGRVINRRKDGSLYTEEMTITPVISAGRGNQPGHLTHFIAIKQNVTERDQDENRQAAIAALTSALRSAVSRSEIIGIILTQTLNLVEGHGAALMMRDSQNGHFTCEQGVGDWSHWKGIQITGQTGASARVLSTQRPFVENDISNSQEPLIRRIFKEEKAVACIPLIVPQPTRTAIASGEGIGSEQVVGFLWVGRNRPFMPGEIRVLVSIADITAGAVIRAALYDETRQRLQRLMAIHALDTAISTSLDVQILLDELLHQLTGDLGVDAADVMLVSTDGWTLRCAAAHGFKSYPGCSPHEVRLGEGLSGRAALEQKTLIQLAPHEEYPPVDLDRLAGEDIVSRVALPLLAKGELKGVLEVFYRRPMTFDPEWLEYLETLAGQTAIAVDNAQLFDQAQRSSQELSEAYDTTLEGWARALELRDRETEGHTRRASEWTMRLGRRLGMSEDELVHVWRGAILHDIGKLGIPDDILSKPGALTDAEWEVMRQHPRLGYELLEPIPYLRPALEIPYCHHERWDGSGYPRGLKGEEIPMAARIFAVADVWDALRSDRPYRAAWDGESARAYIVEQSSKHFDHQVVEAFVHLLDEEEFGGAED